MSEKEFGFSDWTVKVGGKKQQKTDFEKIEWMSLKPGMNQLRIVTKPVTFWSHKYKAPDDSGYGDWVRCSLVKEKDKNTGEWTIHQSCPLCTANDRAKQRWYVGVIDRSSNGVYKLMEFGSVVYEGIQNLNQIEMYADPTRYDIMINFNKASSTPTGFYTVAPMGVTELSAADKQIKDNVKVDEIVKRASVPTPDAVMARVNFFRKKKNKEPFTSIPVVPKKEYPNAKGKPASASPASPVSAQASNSSFDDDDDFPSAD